MRHRNNRRYLNMTSSHRKAMFMNMMVSMLKHEFIMTTLPKAKELRSYLEPLIAMAKVDSVHNRRIAFAKLRDRDMVTKLFKEIGPFYEKRAGGYLRVLKAGFRPGDKAPRAIVELVERSKSQAA